MQTYVVLLLLTAVALLVGHFVAACSEQLNNYHSKHVRSMKVLTEAKALYSDGASLMEAISLPTRARHRVHCCTNVWKLVHWRCASLLNAMQRRLAATKCAAQSSNETIKNALNRSLHLLIVVIFFLRALTFAVSCAFCHIAVCWRRRARRPRRWSAVTERANSLPSPKPLNLISGD